MNRRGAGVAFCFISAFFFLARYLIAAILGLREVDMYKVIFEKLLSYQGNSLVIAGVFYLSIGIAYLIASEIKKEK